MVTGHYVLCFILLILTLGLCIAAVSTDFWLCGNLFGSCQKTNDHDRKVIISSVGGLLIFGSFCILIIILLDMIAFCSAKFSTKPAYTVLRFLLLILSTLAILIGVLLYTAMIDSDWSYFCATVASVIITIVLILTMMSSGCVKSGKWKNQIT
ncbi:unnamed protein product [Schistosoma turkestanicum]|nr:unnamed protein product [Schistosoma turkestanicum]